MAREGLIPDMFKPLVDSLMKNGGSSDRLVFYLNRHIEVDEVIMVHLQNNFLLELCHNNPEKLNRANEIGRKCIETRMKL